MGVIKEKKFLSIYKVLCTAAERKNRLFFYSVTCVIVVSFKKIQNFVFLLFSFSVCVRNSKSCYCDPKSLCARLRFFIMPLAGKFLYENYMNTYQIIPVILYFVSFVEFAQPTTANVIVSFVFVLLMRSRSCVIDQAVKIDVARYQHRRR